MLNKVRKELESRKDRSAWQKGVTLYALELLEHLEEQMDGGYFDPEDLASSKLIHRALLNGASDWKEYSWGGSGSSLIYNYEIAKRLCNPSELKRTNNGFWRPNKDEDWLDVQARALFQADHRVQEAIKNNFKKI